MLGVGGKTIMAAGGGNWTFAGTYAENDEGFIPVTDAGGQAGELMIVLGVASNVPAIAITGWTKDATDQYSSSDPDIQAVVWSRVLDGSETSNVNFFQTSAIKHVRALRFSGGPASPAAASVNTEGTGGNPSSQTVTSGSAGSPAIVIGLAGCANEENDPNVAFSTFSPTYDANYAASLEDGDGDWLSWDFAYKIMNSGLQNVSVDMNDEGTSNVLMSCYYA